MKINAARLWQRLETLSTITEPDRPWTRRSFTPKFLEGRQWLTEQFQEAGLQTSIDAGGNLIGRRAGSDPSLAPIIVGSHSDTVPSGGRYDGILGVMAGLELAHALHDHDHVMRHNLEVIDFLAEEPSEFGLSCIGSRAIAGAIEPAMLQMKRPDGMTLHEGIAYAGGKPAELASVRRDAGTTAAYVELHIEQGPILEAEQLDIGVVTAIAAIRRTRLTVRGRADHAGTTPMTMRSDALVGAAAVISLVYEKALQASTPAQPLVATIGRIENVWPNVANAVAARAELTLECRAGTDAEVATFCEQVIEASRAALGALALTIDAEQLSHVLPTPCSSMIQATIEQAAQANGLTTRRMPSGAGHDGMFVSHTGPIGMIFVPCLGGRSHTPEESITAEQAATGAQVLTDTVLLLDE